MKQMKKLYCILGLLMLALPAMAQNTGDRNFEAAKNIDIFTAICKELEQFYVDTLDSKKVVRKGIDYMLGQLDPYTVYYSDEDMGELKMMTTGKYAGIGSVIRLYQKDKVIISEPYANSPAARAGLKAGDVLTLSVNGKGLSEVNAFGFNLPYNATDLEYTGTEPVGTLDMENLTYDRLHAAGDKVLYPIFVNTGDRETLSSDGTLCSITFRARRACKVTLKPQDALLVDKMLNTIQTGE